jgi:hypothetical protein
MVRWLNGSMTQFYGVLVGDDDKQIGTFSGIAGPTPRATPPAASFYRSATRLLSRLAREHMTDATTLARIWLTKRLAAGARRSEIA